MRRLTQYVFQNPYSSLNPRKSILSIVALPLQVFFGLSRKAARDEVVKALERVGLGEEYLDRFPRSSAAVSASGLPWLARWWLNRRFSSATK